MTGALLVAGVIVGAAPAQAAPKSNASISSDWSCDEAPSICGDLDFFVQTSANEYDTGMDFFDGTYELFNASGKKIDADDFYEEQGELRGTIYGQSGKKYPSGKYTLRLKKHWSYVDDCDWHWNSTSGDFYNLCDDPDYKPTPDSIEYFTYTFNWAGKNLVAPRQSFSATQKKSVTTSTTYSAKKSASHTATAKYTAKESASYKYKGKTYKATASYTTKKTQKVSKSASYSIKKLKRTATASATSKSFHSKPHATNLASKKATSLAKSAATKKAKTYANDKATAKAKSAITKSVKSATYAKAKSKITKKVKADTKSKAKAAALAAAKKKARK